MLYFSSLLHLQQVESRRMSYTTVLTYQSLRTPCQGEPRPQAEHTVVRDPRTTMMYNFEFTVLSQQARMGKWIVHAHLRGDGLDLTANLTLWSSANVRHEESRGEPHDFANQTSR